MKKYPIRFGIFETNSSSSHSFSLGPRGRLAKTIKIDENGAINVSTGDWENGGDKFNDPLYKLSYLICFIHSFHSGDETEILDTIIRTVTNFTGASEVNINIEDEVCVDHQSSDIIDERDLNDEEFIKEFVFNPRTWVYAIWDSYCPGEDFYEDSPPVLYILHFDLPGIEEDVSLPVKYEREDLDWKIDELLSNYYWSGEKFYKEKTKTWYIGYSGNLRFGEKKIDFTITLPNDNSDRQ